MPQAMLHIWCAVHTCSPVKWSWQWPQPAAGTSVRLQWLPHNPGPIPSFVEFKPNRLRQTTAEALRD